MATWKDTQTVPPALPRPTTFQTVVSDYWPLPALPEQGGEGLLLASAGDELAWLFLTGGSAVPLCWYLPLGADDVVLWDIAAGSNLLSLEVLPAKLAEDFRAAYNYVCRLAYFIVNDVGDELGALQEEIPDYPLQDSDEEGGE